MVGGYRLDTIHCTTVEQEEVAYKIRTTGGLRSEKRSRYIYFMEDSLSHAMSKLRHVLLHVATKVPHIFIVHTANIQIRECVKWLLTRG